MIDINQPTTTNMEPTNNEDVILDANAETPTEEAAEEVAAPTDAEAGAAVEDTLETPTEDEDEDETV